MVNNANPSVMESGLFTRLAKSDGVLPVARHRYNSLSKAAAITRDTCKQTASESIKRFGLIVRHFILLLKEKMLPKYQSRCRNLATTHLDHSVKILMVLSLQRLFIAMTYVYEIDSLHSILYMSKLPISH